MPSPRCLVRLLPVGLMCSSIVAAAPRGTGDHLEVTRFGSGPVRVGNAAAQIALTRGAPWQEFQSLHGPWSVVWNEVTGTPHRAVGEGIALAGFADEAGAVDRAVRAFVEANAALLRGAPTLETVSVQRAGTVWYARYRESVRGIPLLFSDWEFRIGANGRLYAFGADAHHPPPAVVTTPRIVGAVAREAAKSGLTFRPSTDRVEGGTNLYVLPHRRHGRTEYRLVYDVRVQTLKPRGNWITLVDAETGEVLWRHNRVVHATISGRIQGRIYPTKPSDTQVVRNFSDLFVNVGSTLDTTDASGNYSAICGGTSAVVVEMKGPFSHVVRLDCENCNAKFTRNVSCPSTRDVLWDDSNSAAAERNALYHSMVARRYIQGLDPAYTASDHDLELSVNSFDDECSAYWDGLTITFGLEGSSCANTAHIPDVVYHEYGHRMNDDLYFTQGSPFGLVNETLHHALADLTAAFILDDPVIGEGYYGSGSFLRDLREDLRWPEDQTPEGHEEARILAGAFWDLRQSVGRSVAERLFHFARYGLPDDADAGVAMSEYFIETLVADDDDANPTNGTPHFNEIVAAFNAHGIGTNFFLNVDHTAIADNPTGGPYPVSAIIQYTGPVGALDLASPTLHYKVNGLPFASTSMFPTGNPDEWAAEIPGQSGAIVRYYITASETNGGSKVVPAGAPSRKLHAFVAGPASAVVSADMESNPGWTVGAPGDNAATGVWVRVDPVGTIAQPEDDHTPAGTLCFVTGNAAREDPPGANDVDDGKTTLLTPIFDATQFGITFPVVSFYRWYSNNAGEAPSADFWRVDISNNGGGSWTSVENTKETDQSWRRVLFFIQDYVPPTNNMRMRFIAEDAAIPSLVEAGVDDFDVLGFTGPVAVGDPGGSVDLALAPAAPNPFGSTTRLSYTLPIGERVDLSVYDLHGRRVRTLLSGEQPAGSHSIGWDGRDDAGRPVASGSYFIRLLQSGRRTTQEVVRIR